MLDLAILGLLFEQEMHGYEIRRRLRDASDVFKVEIFRDNRAPAVRAEFDLSHKTQTFKSASAGSWALTIFRILLMATFKLRWPNRLVPATNVSAPARAHSAAVSKLMPPSTLI